MSKSYSHLNDYEWMCDIWIPGEASKRCSGKVSYSAGGGVRLEIYVKGDAGDFQKAKVLYGISFDIGPFTLTGCTEMAACSASLVKIEMFVSYMLFGDHFSDDCKFYSCRFTTNYIDEFCGNISRRKDFKEPNSTVLKGNFRGLSVSIRNILGGIWIDENNISENFVFDTKSSGPDVDALIEELNTTCSDVLKRYPHVYPYLKNESSYECFLDSGSELIKIHDYISFVRNITGLFSVLMIKTCVPIKIEVQKDGVLSNGEKYIRNFQVLASCHISEEEKRSVSNDSWNPFFNISANEIKDNFQTILSTWEEFLGKELDLTLNVIREHIKNSYNSTQHAVICISALEQWYSDYRDTECNKAKYDYMLDRYATTEMLEKLKEFIPLKIGANEKLGKKIGDIRGIILHPNGVRSYKFKDGCSLDEVALNNIAEVIIIILIRAVFMKFEMPNSVINRFGSREYTTLREHFIIEQ